MADVKDAVFMYELVLVLMGVKESGGEVDEERGSEQNFSVGGRISKLIVFINQCFSAMLPVFSCDS